MKHDLKRPALLLLLAAFFSILPSWGNDNYQPSFSTAGFFALTYKIYVQSNESLSFLR